MKDIPQIFTKNIVPRDYSRGMTVVVKATINNHQKKYIERLFLKLNNNILNTLQIFCTFRQTPKALAHKKINQIISRLKYLSCGSIGN